MRGVRLDHHRAQGANVAAVLVIGVAASPRLRMQPGIRRRDDPLGRRLHRPGFRGAVIVGEKALHGRLAGDLADIAGADPVRQHDRDALQAEQRLLRDQDAMKILIDLLAALVGMLPDRDFQFARHRSFQGCPQPLRAAAFFPNWGQTSISATCDMMRIELSREPASARS